MRSREKGRFLVAAALTAILTPAVFLRVCGLVFGCGCTWFFAGGSALCRAQRFGPYPCPVCEGGLAASLAFGGMIAAVALMALYGLLAAVGASPQE